MRERGLLDMIFVASTGVDEASAAVKEDMKQRYNGGTVDDAVEGSNGKGEVDG